MSTSENPSTPATIYSRQNPFPAVLVENRVLSGKNSAKEVRHVSFDLSGSGMTYRVGQSLGVAPVNAAQEVAGLLQAGGFDGGAKVKLPKATQDITLQEALTTEFYLGSPTKKILEVFAAAMSDEGEKARLEKLLAPVEATTPQNSLEDQKNILAGESKNAGENSGGNIAGGNSTQKSSSVVKEEKSALEKFLAERQFIDLFEEFPGVRGKVSAQTLVDSMKKLQPRLYSIASSPKIAGARVELTVGIVRYTTNGRARGGVCSTFLADRLATGKTAKVFVGESPFKLTDDDAAPVIMVGPGTGIAPFRAFLQERQARGAQGKNWLFFGDQHRASDFLYEEEFMALQKTGLLSRLELAWSRDQERKIYVQDRMRENAAALWAWLQEGAYFYVCGDAKRMAKDVDAALGEIVQTQGKMDAVQAAEFIGGLKKAGRYMRDVY